jgi:hypothetical protein
MNIVVKNATACLNNWFTQGTKKKFPARIAGADRLRNASAVLALQVVCMTAVARAAGQQVFPEQNKFCGGLLQSLPVLGVFLLFD